MAAYVVAGFALFCRGVRCEAVAAVRRFRISGEFYAENIDHALIRLAMHFAALANGDDETEAIVGPLYLVVEPVDD